MTAFHRIRVGLQDSSVSEPTHHWVMIGSQMDVSERALQGTVLHRRIVSHSPTEPAHTYVIVGLARSSVSEIGSSGRFSTD
jgi:hypothetical protein